MKIARFKSVKYDFVCVSDWSDENIPDDYVRLTEYIEVEFTDLNNQEVINNQVALIDDEIKQEQAESHIRVNRLEQRKAELLALPDLSEQ